MAPIVEITWPGSSIINNDRESELSVPEAKALRWTLASFSGAVVLRHGCSTEIYSADVLAHKFAWAPAGGSLATRPLLLSEWSHGSWPTSGSS